MIFRTITGLMVWSYILCAIFTESVMAESLVFPPYLHSYGIRKATPANLFMFFGPFVHFADPAGLATTKMRARDDSTTTHDDDEVVVYGVNSGGNQVIYNKTMFSLALYGSKGRGKDQFDHPLGIAIDETGNVYVSDNGNNRIVQLFNPGKEVHWVKEFTGKSGSDPGLSHPSQVSLDAAGAIYVTDTGNRRIAVFDSSGRLRQTFPRPGTWSFSDGPTTLAIADGRTHFSYYSHDAFFICADQHGKRLWKVGLDGTLMDTATLGNGCSANYAAVDFYHNIWITDSARHCIYKLDRMLTPLDTFGSYGTGDNQFVQPRGIAIHKRYGQVFIAEQKGAQYFWIGTDCKQVALQSIDARQMQLKVNATEYSFISLFSTELTETTFVLRKRFIRPGISSIPFSVSASANSKRPAWKFKIEPTYSSYTYNSWIYPVTTTH